MSAINPRKRLTLQLKQGNEYCDAWATPTLLLRGVYELRKNPALISCVRRPGHADAADDSDRLEVTRLQLSSTFRNL